MSDPKITDAQLQAIEAAAIARGYLIAVDADGTKRLIRPDGTVAVIARPKVAGV